MLIGYEAKINIDAGATPQFCCTHPVPYAMRAKVEQELEWLVCEDILEPTTTLRLGSTHCPGYVGMNLWRF